MLVGGGTLLLLLVAVPTLWLVVGQQTGDEAFQLAEKDYQDGAYTQAIGKFSTYLENYPNHDKVSLSLARVHRGLAKMRLAIDSSSDWPRNLAVTKEVLAEISREEEFEQARSELTALLPRLAAGLANAAREQGSESLIAQSREALDLVNKYVPSSLRPANQLEDIEATLALTRREIDRDASLKKALADIAAAIEAGEPPRAYEVRRQLLKSYPNLEENTSLIEAVLTISAAEQAAVTLQTQRRPPSEIVDDSPVESTIIPSRTVGNPAADLKGQVFSALADGYAFGLDAETGSLLWRRHVGFDIQHPPLVLGDGDALLLESNGAVLSRIDPHGTPRWHHEFESPGSGQPLLIGDRALLSTLDGLMIEVDLASGGSEKQIQFPQSLDVGPATDSHHKWLYQLGTHSNLYVVDANSGECVEVVYLGHAAGSIEVPPVIAGQYIIIAENHALKSSRLRLLRADKSGRNLKEQQVVELQGHVMTRPLVTGRSLHVTTDRGAWYTFDIGTPDQAEPLTRSVALPGSDDEPLIRYPLVRGGDLWLAGRKLSSFEISASQQRLVARDIRYPNSIFLQPLVALGDVLLHVRRNANRPGIIAAATRMSDAAPLWQTELSAPLATLPVVDETSGALSLLTTTGAAYELPDDTELKRTLIPKPQASAKIAQPTTSPSEALIFEGGIQVYPVDASGRRVLVRSTTGGKTTLQWRTLPDTTSGPIVAYQGGIVVPGVKGQVFVIDASSGTELIQPFQPTVRADVEYHWHTAVSPSGDHLLLADQEKLYRVGVQQEPTPHLAAAATFDLSEAITSSIATLENSVFAVTSNSKLVCWRMNDLDVGNSWDIGSGVVLEPVRGASHVFVVDAEHQLWCLNDQQQVLWKTPLEHGPPLGPPVQGTQGLTIATRTGAVVTLDPRTGKEKSATKIGVPISRGPVSWRDRLLLVGDGGSLYILSQP